MEDFEWKNFLENERSRYQNEEMKIKNLTFPRMEMENRTCHLESILVSLRHEWPQRFPKSNFVKILFY